MKLLYRKSLLLIGKDKNIFTPVCHSVHRGGGSPVGRPPLPGRPPARETPLPGRPPARPPCQGDPPARETPLPGRTPPPEQTPPGADTPSTQTPPRDPDPGTHPTGMHSCFRMRTAFSGVRWSYTVHGNTCSKEPFLKFLMLNKSFRI